MPAAQDHLGYGLNSDEDDDFGSTVVQPVRKGRSLFFSWGGGQSASQEGDALGGSPEEEWVLEDPVSSSPSFPSKSPVVQLRGRERNEQNQAELAPWESDEQGEDWEDATLPAHPHATNSQPVNSLSGEEQLSGSPDIHSYIHDLPSSEPLHSEFSASDEDFPEAGPSLHPAEQSEALAGPDGDSGDAPARDSPAAAVPASAALAAGEAAGFRAGSGYERYE